MDKLRAMATFVAIVDRGSLTAAADAVGTSLPSVVRTLAALERELGVRLLNRTTRRLHPTDEGAQYVERCRAVLAAIREAEASLAARRVEPQGALGVTASVLFGRRHVAPVVSAFAALHPDVRVDLLLVDRVVSLVEEGIDVGVRIGHLPDSTLVAIPVGYVRRVVCASPGYLRAHGTPRAPSDVARHSCVHFTGVAADREWRFREGRRSVKVRIAGRITCNEAEAAIAACAEGLGLGSFLSYQVAPRIAAKELRYVLRGFEPEPMPVSVVYPHSRLQSATLRAFVDASVAALRGARFD
jgi:DNA-binding transcriptional LysR family regulator